MSDRSTAWRKAFALALVVTFAAVGAIFLFLPGGTLAFFNALSARWGMVQGPAEGSFFVVLAAAYMTVVTVLAWRLYRSPGDRASARLLVQAKLASSVLSLAVFALSARWSILLVNGLVDGALGLAVWAAYLRKKAGK
jgi:hypothetical protein